MSEIRLFDDQDDQPPDGVLASYAEVRELAREHFNSPEASALAEPSFAGGQLLEERLRLQAHASGAGTRGLVATWASMFGYVSLHDPTTGEWHDLKTEDAPGWARREARRRKELYRSGNRKAYRLTAPEMAEIWEAERVPEPEGIIEDHPIEEEAE